MDFEQACQEALAFRDERDWRQFHNPKDLALSLSLEAAELLEAWQWSGADTSAAGRGDKVAEELADRGHARQDRPQCREVPRGQGPRHVEEVHRARVTGDGGVTGDR